MQSSLWKLAVIGGVVALCLLVINHAREDMTDGDKQDIASEQGGGGEAALGEETGEFDGDDSGELAHQSIEIAPYVAAEGPDPFAEFNDSPPDNNDNSPSIEEPVQIVETPQNEVVAEQPSDAAPALLSNLSTSDEPTLDATIPEDDEFQDDVPARAAGLFDAVAEAADEDEQDAVETDSVDPFASEQEPAVAATDELQDLSETDTAEPALLDDPLPAAADDTLALPAIDGGLVAETDEEIPSQLPAKLLESDEALELEKLDTSLSSDGTEELPLVDEELLLSEDENEDVSGPKIPDARLLPSETGVDEEGTSDFSEFSEDTQIDVSEFDVSDLDSSENNVDVVIDEAEITEGVEGDKEPAEFSPPQGDDPFAESPSEEAEPEVATDSATEEPALLTFPSAEAEMPAEEEGLADDVPLEEPEADVAEPLEITEEPSPFTEEPLSVNEEPEEATPFADEPEPVSVEEATKEAVEEVVEDEPATEPAAEEPATEPEAVPAVEPEPQAVEEPTQPAEPVKQDEILGEGTVDADSPRGLQQPQLTIKKLSPPEAVLGKPFIYSILIKNTGQSRAGKVMVEDEIPRGAKLTGTIPQAELAGKRLIWKLGTLDPGQERKISIRVIPVAEGAIGSVATVNFVAEAAAQTVVKRAELQMQIKAPKRVTLGQPVVFQFQISNNGTADAKKVVVRNILPTALSHPGGNDLEFAVGDLLMGQSRDIQLTLTASEVGSAVNHAVLTAEGDISVTADATVVISDGGVSITRSGPKKRLLKRPASFTNSIKNKAKTPITDVVVVEKIPEGMRFVKASPGGNFDPMKKTVTWRIQQISGQESEDVSVMLLPETIGDKQSSIRVFGENGPLGETTAATKVRGYSRLAVEIEHGDHPAELGERVSYRVRIKNRGTEKASGVLASVLLPEEMKMVSAKGPVEYKQTKLQLDFTAIEKIAPQEQVVIDLLLEAQKPGDARLQVQIQSDQMTKPFNRETATLVFSDQ